MKNHWLEVHRRRKKNIWTAEFSKNGIYVLSSRQVHVRDAHYSLGQFSQNQGRISLTFPGAMTNTSDNELLDFLTEASQAGMRDMIARLRKYNNILSKREIEHYDLSDMTYESLGAGVKIEDIRLTFKFKGLHHTKN